jgi:hypothetical protein
MYDTQNGITVGDALSNNNISGYNNFHLNIILLLNLKQTVAKMLYSQQTQHHKAFVFTNSASTVFLQEYNSITKILFCVLTI